MNEEKSMNWIAEILTSGNAIPLVIAIACLICLIAFLAKKGIIKFKGHGLSVGNDEVERTIVRNQILYAKTAVGDFFHVIPYWEGRSEYRLRYIMELIIDVFVNSAIYNHITTDPIYIELKQRAVWQCVIDHAENPHILNEDFKNEVYKETKHILEKMIEIRKYHQQ